MYFTRAGAIMPSKGSKSYVIWLRSGNNNNPNNSNVLTSSGANAETFMAASLAVRPALHPFAKDKANFPVFNAQSALNRR